MAQFLLVPTLFLCTLLSVSDSALLSVHDSATLNGEFPSQFSLLCLVCHYNLPMIIIVSCFFEPGRIGVGTPCSKGETTRDESTIVTRPAVLNSNDDKQQSPRPTH